jgi:NADH:ubiquinone oxidoreductase subunit C
LKTVEEIKAAIEAAVPGAGVEFVPNPGPSAQHSLRLAPRALSAVATFLRDDAELAFDFLSNVSGVDWPDKEITEKVKVTRTVTKTVDGPEEQQVEETVDETRKRIEPGCLEVSITFIRSQKAWPLVLRMKTREPQRPGGAAFAHAHLALGGVSGARSLRSLRRRLYRPSGPAPHADVGRIQGPPHAQGLRGAGRLRIRANGARCTCWRGRKSIHKAAQSGPEGTVAGQ